MVASLNGTKKYPNKNGVKPSLASDAWEKEGGKVDDGHYGGYGGHSSLGDKVK